VTSGVGDPSYYYLNNFTDPVVPPTPRTVTRNNVTELAEPTTPVIVPPAPVDPSLIGPQTSVDDSTAGAPAPVTVPPTAS
jgi:hypothetical protein